jgi:gluconokinase
VKQWTGFGEYLMLRLFDRASSSISMASGTGLYDPNRCEWDDVALGLAAVKPETLPPVVDGGEAFHGLTSEFRRGLIPLADIPWYPPTGDGACSNLGSGGFDDTTIALNIGTSAAMRVTVEADRTEIVPGLFCYRIDRRRLLTGGAFATGGNMYAWLENALKLDDAKKQVRELTKVAPTSHGLTVLPFWAGERSPGWHPNAQAAILGMNLHTTALDIMRASLESGAYLIDIVRRRLSQRFPQAERIVATGGALTHDPIWAQILADVFGVKMETGKVFEASSRGAALLTLESLGLIKSAADAPIRTAKVFLPNPDHHDLYAAAAQRFEDMYRKLLG